MSQTFMDTMQNILILCNSICIILIWLCIWNPNNYEDSRLMRFLCRITAHFQRSSSTGSGGSSEKGKES